VTVNNVAPIPTILGPLVVDEKIEFSFAGAFTDPGEDEHFIWWDFGEGFVLLNKLTPIYTYVNPGDYLVQLKVEDDDGGVGITDPFTITVLDTTPPDTSISLSGVLGLEGWYVSDVIVTLDPFEEFSNPATTYYMYDGVGWSLYTGSFTITDEGDTTVSFYSIDAVGNGEGVKTELFRIDKTPPVT